MSAVVFGGTVTVTHTAGVFALGFVTLGLSAFIVPEQLYPWLTLVSGVLVVIALLSLIPGAPLQRPAGQTETLTLHVQERYESFDTTGAYAAAVVLALIALTTLILMNLFKPKKETR